MFKSLLPLRSASRLSVFLFLCLTFAVLGPNSAKAQISGDAASSLLDQAGANPLLLLRQRLSQGSLAASGIPLEGSVNPDEYVVGPGDGFTVSVDGQDVTATPVSVGVDGRIVLPDAGAVMVGGSTLTEARKVMLAKLARSFANAEVDVALIQSRQFYVHVSGAVPRPGRYLALPVARVSSVLEFAFADTTSVPVSNTAFRPSLRNIELIHRDGSRTQVDLVRYYAAGVSEANPFLVDGDVINVPAHDPTFSSISIGGYVPFPGSYDFKAGDRLADLIQIAGGLPDNRNVRNVRVHRTNAGQIETFSFSRAEAAGEKGRAFELQALDVISVSQPDEDHGLVHVEGRVQFPGSYPIISGVTTVKDVVDAAGGPRADALLRGAYIERRVTPDLSQGVGADRYSSKAEVWRRMLSADTTAIMQQLRLTDMSFLSRAYFALETRLQNRVSVNLEDVLSETGNAVVLEADDRIIIPEDSRSVYVVGQVNQPGYVPVQPGMTAEFYIAAAGGRAKSAKRVFIVNPATGSYSDTVSDVVFSGDVIFVDRDAALADNADLQRLVMEENRIKSDMKARTAQTVLQSVATLASVVALIVSLRR